LFGDSNAIDRELGSMIDDSRRLFGSNPVDIRDLGSLLGRLDMAKAESIVLLGLFGCLQVTSTDQSGLKL
jgi:hypothetical protein